MNIFAIIENYKKFDKVNYYTIRLEVDSVKQDFNEMDKFIHKFKDAEGSVYEELGTIIKLIKVIGEKGAKEIFFRFENMASALPSSPGKVAEVKIMANSQLRLYCVRINEYIVILCNGGIKTRNKAQDCPNVSTHFRFANKIARKVDEAD